MAFLVSGIVGSHSGGVFGLSPFMCSVTDAILTCVTDRIFIQIQKRFQHLNTQKPPHIYFGSIRTTRFKVIKTCIYKELS